MFLDEKENHILLNNLVEIKSKKNIDFSINFEKINGTYSQNTFKSVYQHIIEDNITEITSLIDVTRKSFILIYPVLDNESNKNEENALQMLINIL